MWDLASQIFSLFLSLILYPIKAPCLFCPLCSSLKRDCVLHEVLKVYEISLWAESLLAFRETKRERNKPSAKRSALRLEGLCFSNCTQGSVPRQQQDNWEWQDEGVGSPQAGSSHLPPKRLSSLLRRSHFAVWEGQPATVEPGKAWQAASP